MLYQRLTAMIVSITDVKDPPDRFFWAEEYQMEFGAIKQILSHTQVLPSSYFDKSLFMVWTYDSDTGLESLPLVGVGYKYPYLRTNQLPCECRLATTQETCRIMV